MRIRASVCVEGRKKFEGAGSRYLLVYDFFSIAGLLGSWCRFVDGI